MNRQMIVGVDMSHVHDDGRWANPGSWEGYSYYADVRFWEDVARICERGGMDFVFFGDDASTPDTYGADFAEAVRWGIRWPRHDMLTMVPLMARVTRNLGFGLTMSTSYLPPFYVARFLASLDHVIGGRLAWNIVTSARRNEAANYGLDSPLPHDARYERADEFVDVCRKLWASMEDGVLLADAATRQIGDPERVHFIHHRGEHFKVRGPLAVLPTPQRAPVLIAAAQSPRGMRFVAENAEFQFASRQSIESMRTHRVALDAALAQAGRRPDDVGVIWGVSVWLGEDRDDALARRRRLIDEMAPNTGRVHLSTQLGYDLSAVPDDLPLAALADEIGAAQGMLGMFEELLAVEGRSPAMSIEQLGREMLADSGLKVCGSGRDVAEQLIEIHESVPGRTGFMLHGFHTMPRDLERIASEVMPVLRAEGYHADPGAEQRTLRDALSSHVPPPRNAPGPTPRPETSAALV